jgi:hypothetical protein
VRWVMTTRGGRRWGKIRRHASWQHEPGMAEAATLDRTPA